MYDIPESLRELQSRVGAELKAHNVNRAYARLVVRVELGFALMDVLRLEDEPITVLWVILSHTPIRHARLNALSAAQQRAIANARLLLPGYAGRSGWEGALRTYIRHIPSDLRLYTFQETGDLAQQIVDACRTQNTFPNRTKVYQTCLAIKLPLKTRHIPYAEANQTYDFPAQVTGEPPRSVTIAFTKEQAALAQIPVQPFDSQPRKRCAFTVSIQNDLTEVAHFIRSKDGSERWIDNLQQIQYRRAESLGINSDTIELDGMTHLAGMVSSGKSTLMMLIAAFVVYEHRILNHYASPKRRITLVVGDTSSSIHLADQLNRWFCDTPEIDQPVAVPLLGRNTRDQHLRQLYASREYQQAVCEGRTHWGERFLNPRCPLRALIPLDVLNKPLQPGTEPCRILREVSKNANPTQRRSPHLCPFFAVCPSQQVYRDMVDAQIWITTPGAMGAGTLPVQLEPRRIRLGDLIYEQSDIVVLDEVDTIIEWFDRLYAQEIKLTGHGNGLLDDIDRKTSEYWSQDRLHPPVQTLRWIEAQRNFLTPIGHILAHCTRQNHIG